ncbi:MAG: diacylglycerol kinase family protein [Anaerolineales bacterium]
MRLSIFLRQRLRAFEYAFSGWGHVLRSQPNAWIHALAGLLVILGGGILRLTRIEWALIVLAIGLVWMAETFNTGIEALCNLVHPSPHPLIKIAKDTSAAAVLIAALSAAIIGGIVFLPHLLALP